MDVESQLEGGGKSFLAFPVFDPAFPAPESVKLTLIWIVRSILVDKPYIQRLDSHRGRRVPGRVARFFLLQLTKTGKIYQMTIKYTKWPFKRQNGHKIYQIAIKYTKWP
jgi:hypothetical protein